LRPLIEKGQGWSARGPTGWNMCDTALWIAANLAYYAHSGEDDGVIANHLLHLVPGLQERLGDLGPVPARQQPTQQYMRAFRALCALVPSSDAALVRESRAYPWLLTELRCGLSREPVPGDTLYPDAFDRCYTVARIAQGSVGRGQLVAAGAVPLLASALEISIDGMHERSRQQWQHATEALHAFATTSDHRAAIESCRPAVDGLLAVAAGQGDLPLRYRRLAADAVIALRQCWDTERVLWCAVYDKAWASGWQDEPGRPPVTKLPAEVVRPIIAWAMLLNADAMKRELKVVDDPLVARGRNVCLPLTISILPLI